MRGTVIGFTVYGLKLFHEKQSPQSCLPVWQHCWWSGTFVSAPWRQKLLTSADQDILGASEYICNLKSAGTKSLSPLVVDFRWAKEPQIWGPTRREFSPPSDFASTWILDKNLWCRRVSCVWRPQRGRRQNTWREENTRESVNPERPDLHFCIVCFTALMLRCKGDLWWVIKQYLDAVNCSFYGVTYRRAVDNLMRPWCLSKCLAVRVV